MPARSSLRFVLMSLFLANTPVPSSAEPAQNSDLGELAKEHTAHPARGTEGLVSIPFEILNAGETPLSCEAKLAHWYSLTLGSAAFGVSISTTFWSDPATGAVVLLNPAGDQMAVERIWCGEQGQSWETRFEIPLARSAGAAEAPLRFSCIAQPAEAGSAPQALTCLPR